MPTVTTYQCDAWVVEDEQEFDHGPSLTPQEAVFLIQIYYNRTPEEDSTMEEDTNRAAAAAAATMLKEFRVKRDYLLHDATSWHALVNMLTEINIPYDFHPLMILNITNRARESGDLDRKVTPIVVHIRTMQSTIIDAVSDASDAAAFMESFDSQSLRLVGATKSAIGALEKVKIQDFCKQCAICLEDFPIGMEATGMPCSHIYHGSCLSNWLEISNLCPLCRFQLPNS